MLSVKIPVAQPRITSPSAYSPLRPDTHSKIPLQGCWDGFRAIRHKALFYQFFFNQCRTACSMPKGISLNSSFISIIIFKSKHKSPPFILYRCFSSIYPLFYSPIQSASWDGAFHPASPEYPSFKFFYNYRKWQIYYLLLNFYGSDNDNIRDFFIKIAFFVKSVYDKSGIKTQIKNIL